MLKKIIFFFIAIVFIATAACKKYPDGGLSTYAEGRICHTWNVSSFTVNGYDSTAYLKSQPFYGTYTFETPKGDNNGVFNYQSANYNYYGEGYWEFSNNKKSIGIYCVYSSGGNIGPYRAQYITWDIMRLKGNELLKNNELWLQTTYNGKVYFVKFNI
jgi:hypothetical protein